MSAEISKIAKKEGLKLVDASHNVALRILQSDVTAGVRKNEHACVFAQGVRRATGAYRAWINRTVVYIQETPEDEVLLRFALDEPGKREVKRFDKTGEFKTGYYNLLKPKGAVSLRGIRAKSKRDVRLGKRHMPAGTKIKRKAVTAHDLRAFTWPK